MDYIDITKRYVIESINDPFIIEFTEEQDIYYDEKYRGETAYECYILDDENEPESRAIFYYDDHIEPRHYLLFHQDGDLVKIKIHRMTQIEGEDTIEETIEKAENSHGLTMGDIC